MKYRIVDENGEIQAEFDTSEKWLPRLMSITTLEAVARYTPVQVTLLEQLQLLAKQSDYYPNLSASNSEAMCAIANLLEK